MNVIALGRMAGSHGCGAISPSGTRRRFLLPDSQSDDFGHAGAAEIMTRYACETFPLIRVYAPPYAHNIASIRVLEKQTVFANTDLDLSRLS